MSPSREHHDPADIGTTTAPGLYFQSTPTSSQAYERVGDADSPSHFASLDLASTHEEYYTYDTWTELQELPASQGDESDTKNLLEARVRRSSTSSSVSSNSTLVRQHRTVRWLEYVGGCFTSFWRLPVIRHVMWPFQWLNNCFKRLLSTSRFHGWRMGILLGCIMSSLVLAINIMVLVVGAVREDGFQGGFAVPISGLAPDMSRWSSAIHILINALSTILLAASNYTMQVLSSPTRKDINKAHAKHEWLDIGVLSMRNLSRIPRHRLLLFVIMGLSSLPVHLFYNSAVFYIGANNEYNLYVFEQGSDAYEDIYRKSNLVQIPLGYDGDRYDTLENFKWSSVYDTALVSYGDLYLAVDLYRSEIDNKTLNGQLSQQQDTPAEEIDRWNRGWISWNLTQTLERSLSDEAFVRNLTDTYSVSKEWIRMDRMVDASHQNGTLKDPPKIQLSLAFLIIVIVCNSVKLLTMLWVVFMEHRNYVVTIGDGAASFLENRDPTTERMCILSKQEIAHEVAESMREVLHDDQLSRLVTHHKRKWVKQYSTYSNALNKDREIGSYFILIVMGILFASFLATVTTTSQASTAWGTKSDTTFRAADSSAQQTLLNAWIANAPQLVLSFCYLAINSECTAMAGAAEWNSLATSRKGLLVTRPYGEQRDTYFLQLPYRWSLPLTAVSGGMHWLLSQSIFLVRIDTYDREGELIAQRSRSACGFSGTSWMILTVCFFILVGIIGLIGRKKIKIRIPFAASSSLVISAACHAPQDDKEPHLRPVRWGVVEKLMFDGEEHCSLSSKSVTRPKVGNKYL